MHKKDWIKRECNGCRQYNAECRSGICFWQQITMSMIKERAARHNMHLEEAVGCGAMGWMVVDQNNVIQTDEHGMSLEELDEYFKN